jgi:signal transduction histidine kinase
MRWRVLALVLIPTVAAIALGGVRIQAARDSAAQAARASQLSILGADVTRLADDLEDERDLTAGYLGSLQAGDTGAEKSVLGQLTSEYAATNGDLATVNAQAAQIGPAYPAVARSSLTFALSRVSALSDLRTLAQHSAITPLPMIDEYSEVISTLLTIDDDIGAGSSSAQLAQTVSSLGSLAQTEDETSQQRAILYAALLQGQFGFGELDALVTAQSGEASNLAVYQTVAGNLPAFGPGSGFESSVTEAAQFNNIVAGPDVDDAQSIEQDAVINGDNGQTPSGQPQTPPGEAQTWYTDMGSTLQLMRDVETDELASITAQDNSLHQGAESSQELTGAIVALLLLVVLAVTIIMARSMIVPLRRLRADALDVAARRLPEVVRRLSMGDDAAETIEIEPIGISSTDEIGEVARAFDQVHHEAVRLAGDEAMLRANLNAMFVNLSRRSQTLIERQLGIIETLEQSEQDSDRLSSLFRLDHLATRMRRNSENLLVLGGHEASHKWSEPVLLVDVVRAAVSEIERFERIALDVQPGILVTGRAASDVVHLLAELLENATTFSPQDAPVMVTGQLLGSGGVLLEITDAGLGIPQEDLAHANWRLEHPPVVDVAVSRRMGLFVVGRLASRHGIRVRLQSAASSGLSALIWLPDAVAEVESAAPLSLPRRRFDADGYGPATTTHGFGMHPAAVPAPRWGTAWAQTAEQPGWRSPLRERTMPVRQLSQSPATPPSPIAPSPVAASPMPASPMPASPMPASPLPASPLPASPMPAASPVVVPPATATQPSVWRPAASQPESLVGTPSQRLPIFDSLESDWFRRGGKPISNHGQPPAESWTSPADEGFRAAGAAVSPATGDVTVAGLPKRVPRANLVPGSVGGQADQAGQAEGGNQATSARSRDAEGVRNRMAGFQRGAREGRAAAPQNYMTDES